jgi:iron complex transport system substrate-binding protein
LPHVRKPQASYPGVSLFRKPHIPTMRIASLQPSISLTLAHLGALDSLCAVTKWCVEALPELATRNLTVLPDSWSFAEANQQALKLTNPDLVIASVPYRPESLTAILKAGIPVLTLAPYTLADIIHDTHLIGRQVDALPRAETLIQTLQSAIADTIQRSAQLPRLTVYCEEWGKPLIHSQPWIAELIAAANGEFVGTPGAKTPAEAIAAADPDVLLFAWCGAGDRVPLDRVIAQRNWHHLRAVRSGRVFCIPDEFLNTPSFNLIEGLACITAALHPGDFPPHPRLKRLQA